MTEVDGAQRSEAETFGSVVGAALIRALAEVGAGAAMLDLDDGAGWPELAVVTDHLDIASVRSYLAGEFRDDALRARVRRSLMPATSAVLLTVREAREHAAAIGCPDAVCRHQVVAPLLGAGQVVGTVRVASERPLPEAMSERLGALTTCLSVRMAQLGFRPRRASGVRLTLRQREVARMVSRGFTNAAIARDLRVTEDAIKKHVRVMMDVLDVANRAELAVVAAHALVGPDDLDDGSVGPGVRLVRRPAAGRAVSAP